VYLAASWTWRTSRRPSSTTCFWAPPSVSSLIMNSTRMVHSGGFLDRLREPAFAPHLEGEQQPQLLHVEAVVRGAALAEIAHRARGLVGIEHAARAHAARREVFIDEPRELAAQPLGERDREALLRPLHQRARHVAVEDAAQQVLGPERAAAKRERQAQR